MVSVCVNRGVQLKQYRQDHLLTDEVLHHQLALPQAHPTSALTVIQDPLPVHGVC